MGGRDEATGGPGHVAGRKIGERGGRMNMTLKPCPFCGGEASVKCEVFAGMAVCGYWVSCDDGNCNEAIKCSTYAFDTKAEAIAAWNYRAGRTCRMADDEPEPEPCMGCGARVVE